MKVSLFRVLLAGLTIAFGAPLGAQAPRAAAPAGSQEPPVGLSLPPAPDTSAAPASSGAANTPHGTVIEKVLVKVNGEILTQGQLTDRQTDAIRQMNREDQKPLDEASLRKLVQQVTPDVLVSAIDELLLAQRARELGVKYTDAQFKKSVDEIKKDQNLDDAKFAAALKEEGVTMDELRQRLERTYLVQNAQTEEFGQRMTITEEELRTYYNAHTDAFKSPATVTLREYFLAVPTTTQNGHEVVNATAEAAAKSKIEAARAKMKTADDFIALVRAESESATKAQDGLIGPLNVADLNPQLRATLEKLKPGDITETLRVPRGYQILRLEAVAQPETMPFDRVRNQIEQQIRSARYGGETQKLLARLRSQALIEWKDEDMKQIYEKRLRERTQ